MSAFSWLNSFNFCPASFCTLRPNLLLIREVKIKTTMRPTSHRSEWPSLKSLQIINTREGVEKREPCYTVGGYVNWCSHYEEQLELPQKTKNRSAIWSWNPPLLGIYPDKTIIQKDTHISMFIAVSFIIAKTWKQPKCPQTGEWMKKVWGMYRDYHTKWGSQRKTNIMISLICGILKYDTIELIYETEKDSQT